jgi:hypothetical protein
MALLLALVAKDSLVAGRTHAGQWEMKAVVPIHRLRGSVLGLSASAGFRSSSHPRRNRSA